MREIALDAADLSVEHLIPVLGQQIRVSLRAGSGVPLVLCNGVGASLEVLDPLVDQLDPDTTVVRFDVPGVGGSSDSTLPCSFPMGRLLPHATTHLHTGGHVDLVTNAAEFAPLIESFRSGERTRSAARWLSCVR